jgi:hypothetical protein
MGRLYTNVRFVIVCSLCPIVAVDVRFAPLGGYCYILNVNMPICLECPTVCLTCPIRTLFPHMISIVRTCPLCPSPYIIRTSVLLTRSSTYGTIHNVRFVPFVLTCLM